MRVMARHMIDANKRVFGQLIKYVEHIGRCEGAYYISTNDEDKEWLKGLNIVCKHNILPNVRVAIFSYKEECFFAMVGLSNSVVDDEAMTPYQMNAGIYTALASELGLTVLSTNEPRQVYDELMAQNQDELYKGHDFRQLKDFLEPLVLYKIQPGSPLIGEDIARLAGHALAQSSILQLPFSAETLTEFEKCFLEGTPNIPFDNLLTSLVSVHWKFSFLDTYRCIERLYPIVSLDSIHQKIDPPVALHEFCCYVENDLKWRPREEDALKKLCDSTPEIMRDLVEELKLGTMEPHKWIYQLRNSIVHYRPATSQSGLTDENWDSLIRSIILLIRHWYAEYRDKVS